MKKTWKSILMLLMIFVAFILQIIMSNNFKLFGMTPNILLVTLIIISMWSEPHTSFIISLLIGVLAELIFNYDIGTTILSYILVSFCISSISKKYRRESKTAVVYMSVVGTSIFLISEYVLYMLEYKKLLNVIVMIENLVVQSLLNIVISYVLYRIFEKQMQENEIIMDYRK
ncbi:MAG: rod shape-determining protein MreD [Clostridia bacterium]|nr:rod shape-determining protein MreD [Clostridia bacterium]MDD4375451.1 rod shape-determining protein MreD [Clostridia bacterium]